MTTTQIEKIFYEPKQIQIYSTQLAKKIHDSGCKPDHVVAVLRGGGFIANIVHETLMYLEKRNNPNSTYEPTFTGITTSRYSKTNLDEKIKTPHIDPINNLTYKVKENHCILIIDDVIDKGYTMLALKNKIKNELMNKNPTIKTAVIDNKPSKREVDIEPDYYINKREKWIWYGQDLNGYTPQEIRENQGEIIAKILGI